MTRIAVVGASLAGVNAAQAIRRAGFDDAICLIGDEPHQPYDRPPLSKQFLTTDFDPDRLLLRPTADPATLDLELKLGRSAAALDTASRRITLDDGQQVDYDGLVIATGSAARTLPAGIVTGADGAVEGLVVLRSLDDARILKQALTMQSSPVVICGAGFIGGEVAASARELGLDVVLVEAAEAPLLRVLDAEAGMAMADLHRRRGVDVRLGTSLTEVVCRSNAVQQVRLSDGTELDTKLVVAGIGAVPNTGWLAGSGLTVDNGVVVDERCRATSNVVAAGDVARWPNERFGGRMMRVEQWDNAIDMGGFAGKSLLAALGQGEIDDATLGVYQPVPWFWSDQYDRKIQLAGLRSDRWAMAQGTLADQQFVRLYLDGDDRLCGVLTWNRPRQAVIGRQLIEAGTGRAEALDKLGG